MSMISKAVLISVKLLQNQYGYTRIISWHIKGLIGTGFQLHMAQIFVYMHNYIELTIESIFPMLSWKTKSASPSIRVLLLLIMTR